MRYLAILLGGGVFVWGIVRGLTCPLFWPVPLWGLLAGLGATLWTGGLVDLVFSRRSRDRYN